METNVTEPPAPSFDNGEAETRNNHFKEAVLYFQGGGTPPRAFFTQKKGKNKTKAGYRDRR
jgi:hypothetical protein